MDSELIVKRIIHEQLGCKPEYITRNEVITHGLGGDDLDLIEIMMRLEKIYGITIPENIDTVGGLVDYINSHATTDPDILPAKEDIGKACNKSVVDVSTREIAALQEIGRAYVRGELHE